MRRAPLLLLVAVPVLVFAQTQVIANQGSPGTRGSWPVYLTLFPDGGLPVSATVTGDVVAYPPDGGTDVNIVSSVRLDSNVSTAPGTWLGVAGDSTGTRLQVDIPGTVTLAGTSNVAVVNVPTVGLANGTIVSLSTSSLSAIEATTNKGVCTYAEGDPDSLSLTTVASDIPVSPLAGRTGVTILNLENSRQIWCAVGTTASATVAFPILPQTQRKYEGLNGAVVSCRCSTLTCAYAYEEEKCYQQP